jgi:branched-chain amino acid transport system ATP-binding protein
MERCRIAWSDTPAELDATPEVVERLLGVRGAH